MKRSVNFVINLEQSLRNCAKAIEKKLNGLPFEEREGSHYVNEQYFYAASDGLEFRLAYSDDDELESYRFWLNVTWDSKESEVDFVRGLKETLLQDVISQDFKLAQIIDFGKKTQKIIPLKAEAGVRSDLSETETLGKIATPSVARKFEVLEVVDVRDIGSFLDWGQDRDLLLPRNEETHPLRIGQKVIVAIYSDKQGRPVASMRLDRHLSKERPQYQENQEVSLLLVAETDLGFKAIVEQKHWGVLYRDEVFQRLRYGQQLKGFVKKLREDGKIDLRINQPGHRAAQSEIGPLILEELKNAGGFLNITDKTDPERIYQLFGVSKKKFKMALGDLYKRREIVVEDKGIRLVPNSIQKKQIL